MEVGFYSGPAPRWSRTPGPRSQFPGKPDPIEIFDIMKYFVILSTLERLTQRLRRSHADVLPGGKLPIKPMSTAKRIFAISFIFVCTTVAWMILGATIFQRTYDQD